MTRRVAAWPRLRHRGYRWRRFFRRCGRRSGRAVSRMGDPGVHPSQLGRGCRRAVYSRGLPVVPIGARR